MTTADSRVSERDGAHIARLIALFALLFQGWHVFDHWVQVSQRTWFGNPDGQGLAGAAVDMAPAHFLYNLAYWAMLVAIYLGLGFPARRKTYGPLVFWLLTFAVLWQSWHMVEHIAQMAQYLAAPRGGGFPGILGKPNGPFVGYWLHFTYNFVAYIPLVIVFFRAGFHRRVGADLRSVRAFLRGSPAVTPPVKQP